ncbi:MAG: hypothetical protein PVF47_15975, partial [Anaerolineae bacterium]
YAGQARGLGAGDLRAGFQGTATALLAGGVIVALILLRTAPGDMAALRAHVARRAVDRAEGD